MAYIESTYDIALTSGGGTINLPVTDPYGDYNITGSATLAASYVIQASGSPITNTTFIFNYEASIVLNGNTLTIFGLSLDASQALQSCFIVSKYDGSAWDTQIQPDFENSNVIETRHIINDAVDKDKIAADVAGDGLGQNANGSLEVKVDSSTIEINSDTLRVKDAGITNAKLATMSSYTLKGNNTGSTATPQDISINTLINTFAWKVTGNSGTTPGTNFVGTTDAQDLVFKTNNNESGRIDLSLNSTAFGASALSFVGRTGDRNAAFGTSSMEVNDTGYNNTAVGHNSLQFNITGYKNTAVGKSSLQNLNGGIFNTGLGETSGSTLTTGNYNTIIGATANVDSASSSKRIAIGYGALADQDTMFALPNDVTKFKWRGVTYTMPSANAAGVLTNDGSGNLTWV